MLLVVAVRYELFCSDPVAVFKQPLQAAAGVGAREEFAEPTQRKFVFDRVFEPTGMIRFRNKFVRMFPLREGSGAHDIFEHAVGFDGDVFGDPVLREGADPNPQSYLGAGSFKTSRARNDLHLFPWGREPFKSARTSVKTINGFGGDG